VGALRAFKDIKVNSISVSEPKEIEGAKGAFTCFAEVDFENESFGRLCDTVFDFMPSSVEVIEPAKFNFTNIEAGSLLNIISGRMHKYDEIARISQFKMNQMAGQYKALQEALTKNNKEKNCECGEKNCECDGDKCECEECECEDKPKGKKGKKSKG
jgi:hypothetical protein